jgi:SAM-dependent methyltransferase
MTSREDISKAMHEHFEEVWRAGDRWEFNTSEFEHGRFARQLEMIADRRYPRVLELGCGAGNFTKLLAPHADYLLGIDVSPTAIERARALGLKNVDFRVQDILKQEYSADEPWDLIVMSETIYCLGWLYPFFEIGYLAGDILTATNVGGRFLMANTFGPDRKDYLSRPWMIHTYRDLFLNVGFDLEREENYAGSKEGVDVHSLISMYKKTKPSVAPYDLGPIESRGRML